MGGVRILDVRVDICICFGSESKRDGRMDGDEVMCLYVTEKQVLSQLNGSNVPETC